MKMRTFFARFLPVVFVCAALHSTQYSAHAQVVTTFAGSSAGFNDATGTSARFNTPTGAAVDGGGNLYIADKLNHRIRKITPGGVVTTFAGSGTAGFANGTGTAAQFDQPNGVAVDGSGNVYVADYGNHLVRKITSGGVVTTLAGSGTGGFADGLGGAAQFYFPAAVAVDGSGNVYVADFLNYRIRKITPGGLVSTLAGSGTAGFADATGAAAQFNLPSGIAVDGSGNVYVADQLNHRIRQVTSGGVVTTFAGSGTAGSADGTGTAAQFSSPTGVAVNAAGTVSVADQGNNRIRQITSAAVVTTLAGSGTAGSLDATGAAAQFNQPNAVAVFGTTLYVADQGNHRIRAIAPPPVPTITSFTPTSAGAGMTVTINGTNFTGAGAVSFGGVAAASFTVVSATQITAVVAPASASGSVSVTAPGGTATLAGFTFIAPPTITSFLPTSAGAGTTVIVTGTNLSGATAVSFGGVAAASYTIPMSTQLNGVVAAGGASGSISITTPGGTATLPGFTFIPPPTITSFTPTSAAGGATVTITGTNFLSATQVRFGGVAATSFMVVSATQITAVVAAGGATGSVQVTTPGGVTSLAGFTFIPAPTITSFSPAVGGLGTTIVINGTNLAGATVTIGGTPVASIVSNTGTVLTVTAGAGTTGLIQITTPGGVVNSASNFTWNPAPTITSYTPTSQIAGGLVTITGTNFVAPATVSFGGVAATGVTVVSATQITANVGAAGATGSVQVTTPGGTISSPGFTFLPSAPTITSFTPTTSCPGQTVTINGTNFVAPVAVTFGGVAASSVTIVSPTQVTAVVPAGGASGNVGLTALGGGPVTMGGFTFIATPTITSFTPTSAMTGTVVTITGTNFTPATQVQFGGTNAATYTVVSATQIDATVAGGATGSVRVNVPGGCFATMAGFTYLAPVPTVTSFSPTSAAAGTTITINGTNFTGATQVRFGGVNAASYVVVSSTQITAVVAAGGASGSVTVTTPGGTGTFAGFTFIPPPVITSFTPTLQGNGGTVTITGTNFLGATAVSFGGTPASGFTVVSATTITATVAAGASGNVSVTGPGGTGIRMGFTFAAPPTITSFTPTSAGVGATVTITGTNFTGATAVSFGGTAAASFMVVSATQINAVVAAGATGIVSVITPGGTITSGGFTFVPAPTISSFTPTSAAVGATVTINGNNFTGATAVSFGGTAAASYIVMSPTVITAVVAAGATGAVQVTTLGGTATSAGFLLLPTIASFTPTSAGGGTTVTINGSGFTGATAVSIGGVAATSYTVVSSTQITAVVSAAAANGSVSVTTPGGNATSPGFTFIPPPTITSFAPGSQSVGLTVTINGTNFLTATGVSFGGFAATSFTVVSATQIDAVVSGSGGTGSVQVTTLGGVATSPGFTFVPSPPTITSFTPTTAAAGATVTIMGTNFAGVSVVTLGTVPVASFVVVSATQIDAVVGAGATGSVRVTALGGTIVTPGFTFIPAPNISSFAPTTAPAGATVTITGTNFLGATAVSFGGTPATSFTVVSATQITAVVGAGASGSISVTAPGGTGTRAGFTFSAPPAIASFAPTIAPAGTTVTITGTNFTGATAVSFGGTPAMSFTVVSATQINAVVGVGATGNVSVTTPNGSGSLGGFTFVAPPTITSFAPTNAAQGATVLISGSNFTGITGVSFGATPATSFSIITSSLMTAVVGTGSTGNLQVSGPGGTASAPGFTYVLGPMISSFSPTSAGPGITVTITGAGFLGASVVSFGGVPAASFTVISPSQINAVVAAGGASGNVLVTTGGGTSSLAGFSFFPTPTVTSFTPTSGNPGTGITINGTNFIGATSVTVGGVPVASFTVLSSTQIGAVIAGGSTGSVAVSTPGGTASLPGFTFSLPAPTITSFTPTAGASGATVTITGTNFYSVSGVSFGGTAASSFTVISPTQITATVAAGASGNVSVTTSGGTATRAGFVFYAPPTITGFTPSSAPTGTVVTITGTNFLSPTVVSFGGTTAGNFTVISPTQINAQIGIGASGSVAVTASGGTATLAGFTYLPAPVVSSFTPNTAGPGLTVTISGANFVGTSAVSFGGIPASSFTVVSPTQITAVLASGSTGSVSVTSIGGTGSLSGFTFVQPPVITSFTPTSRGPGGQVSIIGTNFTGATAVRFGGVVANSFTINSPTQITAVVGQGGASGSVSVQTPGGTGSLAGFTFVPAPVITSFAPTSGVPGQTVIISGSNFTPGSTVSFGSVTAASVTVVSPSQIQAVVPGGAGGILTVTTTGGTASLPGFTFVPAPTVTGFVPTSALPETTITISGTNLNTATKVTFGGVPAKEFMLVSPTQLLAVVSDGGASGSVLVATPDGSDSLAGFTFIPPQPTITGFSPTSAGPNMVVTISGTGFRGASTATFGGVPALSFQVVSATQIRAVISTGATGSVAISTLGGSASLVGFTFVPAPTITGITPSSAIPGDTITIIGTNFSGATAVNFGGNPAPNFVVVSPTQIRAIARIGGNVSVTTPGGTAVSTAFTTIPPPRIISFTPTASASGGTITIIGANFSGIRTVNFGGVPASTFAVVTDTLITAVVGSGASGSVSVSATAGTASLGGFTFIGAPTIADISPASGGPGIAVTITGTNLAGATSVRFGSVSAADFTVLSPTQIVITVPSTATVGVNSISIVTPGGTVRQVGAFTFIPAPVLTSFSPTSAGPGTTITLVGANLTGVSAVSFGGVTAASFSVVSDTLITAVLANGSSGTVSVLSSGGTASLAGFVYVPPAPVVSSFTPTSAGAGVTITINGANFIGVSDVSIGNVPAVRFTVVSPTQILAVVATNAGGSVSVTSITGTGTRAGFTFIPAPSITSISPTTIGAGGTVRIIGTNLANASSVSFGGVPAADFTVISPTEIRAVVGTGASGRVEVVTPGGLGFLTGFALLPPPRISSFTPTSAAAGAVITINGANFVGASSVSFGGIATTNFTLVSPTQITVTVPANAIGGAISVTTPGGTGSSSGFTLIPPPTISSVNPASAGVGATVTITGTNFTSTATVRFGTTLVANANLVVVSPTQIRAVVPLGTTGGSVSVTTQGGTATFAFTLLNAPRITAFSPTIASSGTVVTITGANLTGAVTVSFGNVQAANFDVLSDTQIRAVVGTGASGSVAVETPGGAASFPGFTYLGAPTVVVFAPMSAGAGRVVTIIGTSFTAPASVSFGGVAATGVKVVSPTQITATVQSGASGEVVVTTSGGKDSLPGFTFIPAPIISRFSPTVGATGTPIVIVGENLSGATGVEIGGTNVPFTVNNGGQITVIVPIGGVANGAISVRTAGGVGISNEAFRFIPPPIITSSDFVQSRQGVILRVSGLNFIGVTTVTIGRFNISSFTPINQSQVTAAIPIGASPTDAVSLFTPGGVATYPSASAMPQISSVSPSRGVAGTRVVLTGQLLNGTTRASIGGIDVPFSVISPAQVVLTIPASGASGVIGLTTPQGVVTTTTTFTLITNEPAIASFSPTQGDVGTVLRVTGENLNQVTAVFIGGVSIPIRSASASQLVLTIPVGATSGNIVLASPIGVTISTGRFLFTPGGVVPPSAPPIIAGMLRCFPNPATDNITIAYALEAPQRVKIHLLDMRGNTLQILEQGAQDKGEYTTILAMNNYAIGTYIIVVETPVRKMQALVTVIR